ncbi:MAG TPA: hypothetical protein VF211_14955 [Burkholderiales bacterium]
MRWVVLALALAAGSAVAQRDGARERAGAAMSQDQRQRMREDMREVYRERSGERFERSRPERPRRLSPQEREQLRRDVQDANRALRR